MTHRQYVRDLAVMVMAAIGLIAVIGFAGPRTALILVLVVAPAITLCATLQRTLRRPPSQVDAHCSKVDQELDARRQLRVIRTVTAEPQPAPVVDMFTRETVA